MPVKISERGWLRKIQGAETARAAVAPARASSQVGISRRVVSETRNSNITRIVPINTSSGRNSRTDTLVSRTT